MTLRPILLVFALACFLFAAFAPPARVNATALGLALCVLSVILG